ncbi:hypothetical protein I9W82_000751 [Candida metapsilosis]|uniref:Uncharacterized protein n=1 Tax=Candida metapsilosis TaxID=273372 RepID=A0A8H7ZJ57_9ASCO|nr:hypothetical protein I9W82_000751 [Candida metapsilosis]
MSSSNSIAPEFIPESASTPSSAVPPVTAQVDSFQQDTTSIFFFDFYTGTVPLFCTDINFHRTNFAPAPYEHTQNNFSQHFLT